MSDQNEKHGWFATIAYNDPLVEQYNLDNTYSCRLFRNPVLPLFEIRANGEHLRFVDPRDVLFALGSERISFLWPDDKEGFVEELSSVLKERDIWIFRQRIATKIGIAIAACSAICAGLALFSYKKNFLLK